MASLVPVNQASGGVYQFQQLQINSHLNPDLYNAALVGNFDAFNNHLDHLDILLTPKNNTILHIYITAQTKAKSTNDSKGLMQQNLSGRYQFVEQVLNQCPSLLTKANIKGETPLHIAARYGHDGIILILAAYDCARAFQHERDIESGVSSNFWRMTSITNETALHEAARNGHLQVVELLIQKDPGLVNMCNDARETPLYLAVERGHRDVAAEVLKSCFSQEAYDGPCERTVLHAAVIRQDAVMTERIIEMTRGLTRRVDKEGWTPLHYASFFASKELVELLLKFDKFAAYIQDIDGRTPLLVAAIRRHGFGGQKLSAEVMRLIISECPDCCELVDPKGQNVLHLAAKSFNNAAMHALLQAPSLFNLINEKDDEGNTPYHVLANVGFNCNYLVRHRLLDSMVVNDRNFTAVDIIETSEFEEFKEKVELKQNMEKADKYWGSWRHKLQMEPLEKVKGRIDKMMTEYKRAKDSHLIVATLIATVTFAAAFTLPGGYEDDDPHKGYAVLFRRLAFKVFIITDAITLAILMCVIFIHFLLALQGHGRKFYWLFYTTFKILPFALGSMALAFLTGICAALPQPYAITIVNFIIAAIAVVICLVILRPSYFLYQIKQEDKIFQGRVGNFLLMDTRECSRCWVKFFLFLPNVVTQLFCGKEVNLKIDPKRGRGGCCLL